MRTCQHHDPGTHRHAKGFLAIDYKSGDAAFRPDARGNVIRTTCGQCGAFIGYRPLETKRR